jgi:hypothetical protein
VPELSRARRTILVAALACARVDADHTGGSDAADLIVLAVGDEHVAAGRDGHGERLAERGVPVVAVIVVLFMGAPCEGDHANVAGGLSEGEKSR